jgi:hypothetical protein
MKYYVRNDKHGEVQGPFAVEELLARIKSGSIAENRLASSDLGGSAAKLRVYRACDWFSVASIPEVRRLFRTEPDWLEVSPRAVELAAKMPVILDGPSGWRSFRWLLDSPRVKLSTPLSPEEFARKFRKFVDRREFTLFVSTRGSTRFRGSLLGETFELERRMGRQLSTFFYGRLRPSASGVEIDGRFSAAPLTKAFAAVGMGWVLLVTGAGFIGMLSAWLMGSRDTSWPALLVMGGTAGVVGLTAMLASSVNRDEEIMFLEFLAEVFGTAVIERRA